MRMLVALTLGAVIVIAACNGGADESDQTPLDKAIKMPDEVPTEQLAGQPTEPPAVGSQASDEADIEEILDGAAKAASREDWSDVYDLYAPSLRETCLRGRFLATMVIAVEISKAFLGEEGWEALKADFSDGYEIQSIMITDDRATIVVLETDEEILTVRENGQWWYYEENPCEIGDAGEE